MANPTIPRYHASVGKLLARCARAMKAAIDGGNLDPETAVWLPMRMAYYINHIKTVVDPALTAQVTAVNVYRDGTATPIWTRAYYSYAEIVAAAKTVNNRYDVDDQGTIYNINNGRRFGYVEIIAEGDDGLPLDVTAALIDQLRDFV